VLAAGGVGCEVLSDQKERPYDSGRPFKIRYTNNMDPKNLPPRYALVMLACFGLLAFLGGWLQYNQMRTPGGWVKTEGAVTRALHTGATSNKNDNTVRYLVNGTAYEARELNNRVTSDNIGNKKTVAYNPAAPAESKVLPGFLPLAIVFPLFGIFILVTVWWLDKKYYRT